LRADVLSVVQESGIVLGTATCGPEETGAATGWGAAATVVVVGATEVVVVTGATVVVVGAAEVVLVVGATVVGVATSGRMVVEVVVVEGTEVVVVGPDGSFAVEPVAVLGDSVAESVDVTVFEELELLPSSDAGDVGSAVVGLVVATDVDVETAAFPMPTAWALADRSATVLARTGVWPGSAIAIAVSTVATAAR